MTGITEKIASLEADAKEAYDCTNMPMEVDPRAILELIAHIRDLLAERAALRAEVALERNLKADSIVVTDEMVEAVQRIWKTAMRQSVVARIPECGEFGGIAQDADWLLDVLMEARND